MYVQKFTGFLVVCKSGICTMFVPRNPMLVAVYLHGTWCVSRVLKMGLTPFCLCMLFILRLGFGPIWLFVMDNTCFVFVFGVGVVSHMVCRM